MFFNVSKSPNKNRPGSTPADRRAVPATSIADIVDAKVKAPIKRMFQKLGFIPTDALVSEFEEWRLRRDIECFVELKKKNQESIERRLKELPIRLPNAKVGEPYRAEVVVDASFLVEMKSLSVSGLAGTGLKMSHSSAGGKLIVEGEPKQAGTIDVTLSCTVKTLRGDVSISRTVPLIITPDPRTLWKDIPTDDKLIFFKDDLVCDYKKVTAADGVAQKDMVAASRRGRSHAHEGRPRDDHFRLEHLYESGWYLMAVADGAGSAKYSREGSRLACDGAIDYLAKMLCNNIELDDAITAYANSLKAEGTTVEAKTKTAEGDANANSNAAAPDAKQALAAVSQQMSHLIAQAAFEGRKAVVRKVEANADASYKLRDFATTLLLAIAKRFDFGWVVATFWVGDGAIALYAQDADEQTRVMLMGEPDGGEYAGQTRFLTMEEIFRDQNSLYKRIKFTIVNNFKALMLMTDGVSDAWFDSDASLSRTEAWDRLWSAITKQVVLEDDHEEAKDELLEWLNFWSVGNHDDRTIAILY